MCRDLPQHIAKYYLNGTFPSFNCWLTASCTALAWSETGAAEDAPPWFRRGDPWTAASALAPTILLRKNLVQRPFGRSGSVKIVSHSLKIEWNLRGSFPAVSTPIFANKYYGKYYHSTNIYSQTLASIQPRTSRVHPAFSSRRKAVVSHLQSRSHFGAVSEYSFVVVQHDSIFHFCLPPLPPFFCLFMIFWYFLIFFGRKDHSARTVFVF